MNNGLKRIAKAFNGVADVSHHRFYNRQSVDYKDYLIYDNPTTTSVTTMQGYALHIPEDRVTDFASIWDELAIDDYQIRQKHPAVKKAWDHYQLLLTLAKSDHAGY